LHVWRASLDFSPDLLHRIEHTLSTNEKERAQRFLVPYARERFIAGRGILRDLLGTYLKLDPGQIDFEYGADGKPSLSPAHNSRISFSVSHSQNMGLFALAAGSEVGVDIEQIKPDFKGMEIAAHFFSEQEVAGLAELPPEAAMKGFFSCWTKKEAYVKAHGHGLSMPLRSFTVNFVEDKQTLRNERGGTWSCYTLAPAPGFAGAVVVAGGYRNLRYWEWSAEMNNLNRFKLDAQT
jgi:4'-phosphopantetheinyl transferase